MCNMCKAQFCENCLSCCVECQTAVCNAHCSICTKCFDYYCSNCSSSVRCDNCFDTMCLKCQPLEAIDKFTLLCDDCAKEVVGNKPPSQKKTTVSNIPKPSKLYTQFSQWCANEYALNSELKLQLESATMSFATRFQAYRSKCANTTRLKIIKEFRGFMKSAKRLVDDKTKLRFLMRFYLQYLRPNIIRISKHKYCSNLKIIREQTSYQVAATGDNKTHGMAAAITEPLCDGVLELLSSMYLHSKFLWKSKYLTCHFFHPECENDECDVFVNGFQSHLEKCGVHVTRDMDSARNQERHTLTLIFASQRLTSLYLETKCTPHLMWTPRFENLKTKCNTVPDTMLYVSCLKTDRFELVPKPFRNIPQTTHLKSYSMLVDHVKHIFFGSN